jgi:tetratricopeptide (TPR) repeat protein
MLLYLLLIFFLFSCKSDAELSMERGIQYYEWGKYNEAILEFNHAKYFQLAKKNKSYDDIKLLAQTHYNLSITYAKLQLFDHAIQEAQHAFNLIPNKEYREILGLISKELASK